MNSRFSPRRRERLLNVAELRQARAPLLPREEASSATADAGRRDDAEDAPLGHATFPLE